MKMFVVMSLFVTFFSVGCGDDITQVIFPAGSGVLDAGSDKPTSNDGGQDSAVGTPVVGPDGGQLCSPGAVRCGSGRTNECDSVGTWQQSDAIDGQMSQSCDPQCTAEVGTFVVDRTISLNNDTFPAVRQSVVKIPSMVNSSTSWLFTRVAVATDTYQNAENFCTSFGSGWNVTGMEIQNLRSEQGAATVPCSPALDQAAILFQPIGGVDPSGIWLRNLSMQTSMVTTTQLSLDIGQRLISVQSSATPSAFRYVICSYKL